MTAVAVLLVPGAVGVRQAVGPPGPSIPPGSAARQVPGGIVGGTVMSGKSAPVSGGETSLLLVGRQAAQDRLDGADRFGKVA